MAQEVKLILLIICISFHILLKTSSTTQCFNVLIQTNCWLESIAALKKAVITTVCVCQHLQLIIYIIVIIKVATSE